MDFMGALRQVWIIARHSVMQAVRMRIVIVLAAFLLVLVPALPFLLKTDQTHLGQVRMVITYSTYLISFLLSVLTLFLSAIALNTEIKHQHIFLLDPKPVPRVAVLAGKWLGVMLINIVLLAVMLAVSYGLVLHFSKQRPKEDDLTYEAFRVQALAARRTLLPPTPDLQDVVDSEYKRLKAEGRLPEGRTEAYWRRELTAFWAKSAWRVPPGASMKWVVTGIPMSFARTDDYLTIKFRHYGDSGSSTHELMGRFSITSPSANRPVTLTGAFLVNKPTEFAVPTWVIRPEDNRSGKGSIEIEYTNLDEEGVAALFPYDEGIQVMYPEAGLGANYFRAGVVILAKLAFIAVMGLFASTFLSFPVAVLLTLVVFMVGQMADFMIKGVIDAMYVFGSSMVEPGTPPVWGDVALRTVLKIFFHLFPNFVPFDVVSELSGGQLITISTIGVVPCILLAAKGVALAVLGWYIFRRRELAALTANM